MSVFSSGDLGPWESLRIYISTFLTCSWRRSASKVPNILGDTKQCSVPRIRALGTTKTSLMQPCVFVKPARNRCVMRGLTLEIPQYNKSAQRSSGQLCTLGCQPVFRLYVLFM